MAIQFKVHEEKNKLIEEQNKLQEQENELAKKENRKAKKIKIRQNKKTVIQNWANTLFVLSIIAVVYAATYTFSGLFLMIPTMILWLIWFCIVFIATAFTVGAIWLSDGWRGFNDRFIAFNNSVTGGSVSVTEFFYKIFPYLSAVFTLCVVGFLIVSIIGKKQQNDKNEGFKGKLIASIILTVLFVGAMVFDIISYNLM